jgi:hypothetical protein
MPVGSAGAIGWGGGRSLVSSAREREGTKRSEEKGERRERREEKGEDQAGSGIRGAGVGPLTEQTPKARGVRLGIFLTPPLSCLLSSGPEGTVYLPNETRNCNRCPDGRDCQWGRLAQTSDTRWING